jgi:hypothetical protein
MKTRIILLVGILSMARLAAFAQTASPTKIIDAEWLKGDRPKLLSAMANSPVVHEELSGSSLSLGTLLGGWHAQAVGQYGDFIYVAFSDGKLLDPKAAATKQDQLDAFGKLWIYNSKTKEGQLKELPKGYAHPCSIQITGKYMTIAIEAAYGTNQMAGIERNERSMIQIYDLEKDPKCSVEVSRIVQDNMNCGGAGLAYSPTMKCWYLFADQDFSNGRSAIYRTENANLDSWRKEPIGYYPRFGAGTGTSLITASDNSIWGLFCDTSDDNLPSFSNLMLGGNMVKLFKVIEADGTLVQQREVISQIVSIGAPLLKSAGELLANRPGMRFGAGIRLEGDKMELLMCQRNMNSAFKVDRTQLAAGDRTQVMFVNFAKARGEINVSSQSNASQTNKIQNAQTESWNGVFQSPVKADIKYMPISLKAIGGLNAPKWTDALVANSSAPLVLYYIEGEGAVKAQMLEFYASKQTDSKK